MDLEGRVCDGIQDGEGQSKVVRVEKGKKASGGSLSYQPSAVLWLLKWIGMDSMMAAEAIGQGAILYFSSADRGASGKAGGSPWDIEAFVSVKPKWSNRCNII